MEMNKLSEGSKIAILGAGYVGLVSGVGFAYHGNKVMVADVVKEKVELINKGKSPFYEPGLDDLLSKLVKEKLLYASNDIESTVKDAKYIFICVGTPMNDDGSINLEYIRSAALSIGKGIKGCKDYKVIVAKSTIIPTTTEKVIIPIIEKESGKKAGKDFGVCMNPEFLAEGDALNGALKPDRIVIGALDKKSAEYLE
ncbi:MAG: nucleotide sugar dehydrogenase, partial [Thermoplasmata archaeon]